MSAPSLKDLIGKATPGKWHAGSRRGYNRNTIYAQSKLGEANDKGVAQVYGIPINHHTDEPLEARWAEGDANAQLIARCNPATLLAVHEALESCSSKPRSQFGIPYTDHFYDKKKVERALNLLNATES